MFQEPENLLPVAAGREHGVHVDGVHFQAHLGPQKHRHVASKCLETAPRQAVTARKSRTGP